MNGGARLRILCLVHQPDAGSGVFAEAVRELGHQLDERCVPAGDDASLEGYAAVIVLGGSANVDEEDRRPWLRTERGLLEQAVALDRPVLGVCLGAQQLADAAGAAVFPIDPPEIGWHPITATGEAPSDALLGSLAESVCAVEWHGYGFELPAGATPLYRNDRGWQAFRLGTRQWGIQFHAEVTRPTYERWMQGAEARAQAEAAGVDLAELRAITGERIGAWNDLGRELCRRFLAVAADGAGL